jgi:DNA-binding SARP family transcriptional activator
MAQPRLAKLTRPRSDGLLRRGRLFALLDESRKRPLAWLTAPPGAGKTSLVASYLDARRVPGLWYQLDSGDADPATFFYYLGLAAGESKQAKKSALPLFTQEHQSDVVGFARRFFRELYVRLPDQAVLVLDNYQDVPESSQLHAALQAALEEVPEGINIVAMSRAAPPVEFARLRAAQRLAAIEWEQLRLTLEETTAIAAAEATLPEDTLRQLFEQTHGWAAGVILMLERLRQTGQVKNLAGSDNLETVFDYFAGQLLSAAPAEQRDMLLRMSYLPRLTAELAQAITGNPEAGRLLGYLSKRNLFIDRRYGEETSYQFHALFRIFLQSQARNTLGAAEHTRLAHSAAALLQTAGQVEDAFPLYVETAAWDAAARLIRKEAPRLVQQGRRQTLRKWISALPFEQVEGDPWLLYWLGLAVFGVDLRRARELFSVAFDRFAAEGHLSGQMRAAYASADSFVPDPVSVIGLDPWIDRLAELLARPEAEEDGELLARTWVSYSRALFTRRPIGAQMRQAAERLHALLGEDVNPDTRVYAGSVLLLYHWFDGAASRADAVIGLVDPLLEQSGVQDANRLLYQFFKAYHYSGTMRIAQARGIIEQFGAAHEESGFGPGQIDFFRSLALTHIYSREYGPARELLLTKVEPQVARIRVTMRAFQHFHLAICALGLGDPVEAVARSEAAMQVFDTGTEPGRMFIAPTLAGVFAATGDAARALELIEDIARRVGPEPGPWIEGRLKLFEAYARLKSGQDQAAIDCLRRALQLLAGIAYTSWVTFPPRDFFRLFALALEHRIEPDFVRSLIQTHRPPVPDPVPDAWPWPLRIRALGSFEVQIDDKPLDFGSKPPHKLLELLKAIVAMGNEQVGASALADELWSDAEGDAAQKSLEVNLHRLRKLLGRDDAILVRDGKVSLNPETCWTDVRAFRRRLERLESLPAGSDEQGGPSDEALALYRGHLLAHEKEQHWLLKPREDLRRAWLGLVRAAGERYERAGDWEAATALYHRALAIDPVAEELYRRLMIALKERGDHAQAASTYRQCREQLAAALGVKPSGETERVYRSLNAG